MLLRILVTCPEPVPPQLVTSVAKQRIKGSMAANNSGEAPTITLRVPSCAAWRVRAIGASAHDAPLACNWLAKSRVWVTDEVPRSTTTCPERIFFRMPSPSNTARACFTLGRHKKHDVALVDDLRHGDGHSS